MALMLASCSSPGPAPTPSANAAPSGELVFTVTSAGAHRVIQSRDGAEVADLGPGVFVFALTGGGDVGEAYLVGPEPEGIRRVKVGRPFTVVKIAPGPQPGNRPPQAVLVPAPGLTSFVGQPTVLIVRGADGSLAAYQGGQPLWKRPPGTAGGLLKVGNLAFITSNDGLAAVVPETGATGPAEDPDCQPAGDVGGKPAISCFESRTLIVGGQRFAVRVGAGAPTAFHPLRGTDLVLYWAADGTLCHVAATASCRTALAAPRGGRVAFAPDARFLFTAELSEIVVQPVAAAGPVLRLPAGEQYRALAASRDGTYLYAAGAGHLDVWSLQAPAHRTLRFPADAADIELVAGG